LQLKDKKLDGKRKLRLDRCKVSVAEGGKPSLPINKKGAKDTKGAKGSLGVKGGKVRKITNSKAVNSQLNASAFEGTRATKEDKSTTQRKKHRIRARTIAYKQKKPKAKGKK
jgi:hypothetical protein